MGFFAAVGSCFKKYFTFSGRASRAEYWWWTLFVFLGSFVYSLASKALTPPLTGNGLEVFMSGNFVVAIAIGMVFTLFTLVPSLAVTVRRLHDTGRSGGWILMPLLLNMAMLWGALIAKPAAVSALGLKGIGGDPMFGNVLLIGAGVGQMILSVMMLVWMLQRGTRGDNIFGPDPYEGGISYGEEYTQSYVPEVNRGAPSGAAQMSHREAVSALYRDRVLAKAAPRG